MAALTTSTGRKRIPVAKNLTTKKSPVKYRGFLWVMKEFIFPLPLTFLTSGRR